MPSVITGKQGKSQRMRNDRKRGGSVAQPEAKEHWQTLETGKEKKKKRFSPRASRRLSALLTP